MTPFDPTDEQLAAWLAGDLEAADAAAVEARVQADAAVAARADALADVLAALSGAEEAALPEGYEERLRARLIAEAEASPQDPSGAAAAGVAAPGPGAAGAGSRPGGSRPGDGRPAGSAGGSRHRRLQRVLSGLAVVALLGVGSLVAVRSGGFGGGDATSGSAGEPGMLAGGDAAQSTRGAEDGRLSMEELSAATEAETAGEAAAEATAPAAGATGAPEEVAATDDAAAADTAAVPTAESAEPPEAGEGAATGAPAVLATQDGPTLLDSGVDLPDTEAVRARYADRTDLATFSDNTGGDEDGSPRATQYAEAVRAAPPFTSGPSPAACLDQLLGGERLVVLVETVVYDGRPALAYLLLDAGLARVAVTDPATCQELAAVDL